MKRLSLIFLFLLLLVGCGKVEQPEFQPTSGVQMDLSKLEKFAPVEEVYTRLSEERVEDLTPGDYGLLRPFVGSRAAFDMTIYGGSGIYNGNMGLIDENGAIVVDPVYTGVTLLTDWYNKDGPKLYRLSKEVQKGDYMDQIHGFCTLDGSVAEPCIYESIQYSNGYIVAVNRSKDGLLRIFDAEGNLLLDSETWTQRYPIYSDMGYSSVEVSENLLFLGVTDETAEYGMARWLCDWEGNILSKDYSYVTLTGEAPYPFGNWDGGPCGYLDEYGNLLSSGYESVNEYYFGQALVARNGQRQVIDIDGNVLWTAPGEYFFTFATDTTVYYQQEVPEGEYQYSYRYYNSEFEQMYPEADHVSHLIDDWFFVWQDGVGTVTDGKRSTVLDGAVRDAYYSVDDVGNVLITTYISDDGQIYWLFDENMKLLKSDMVGDAYVNVVMDQLSGDSVLVSTEAWSYPAQYRVLDYADAPKLENVNVIAVYDGWYMVEDEFSAGYMDKDGNWLFRISLMEDMVD